MVNITRNSVTDEQREQHKIFLQQHLPSDDQQVEYLRTQFPTRPVIEILQIFQILNDREFPRIFQTIQSLDQIQNPQKFLLNSVRENNNIAQPVQNNLVFVDDLYQGDINPGTTDGAKLYIKATAAIPEDEKFDLTILMAQKFLDLMQRDSNNFGWGHLI